MLNETPTSTNPFRAMVSRFDPLKWLIVLGLIVCTGYVLSIARNQVVRPFDNLVTERLCLDHGEEIERTMTGYERSNRFGWENRSEGFCRYGEGPNGEAPITMLIEDTSPGPLYRGAKIVGIIVQLGIASIFLRIIADPVLDFYAWLRFGVIAPWRQRAKQQRSSTTSGQDLVP